MREIGYLVVDRMVEHLATLSSQRVGAKGDPATLTQALSEPAPEQGMQFEDVLAQLERDVLSNTMHVNHPRFLAYVPGPGNFVGAMADALISGYNVFAGTWVSGSGAGRGGTRGSRMAARVVRAAFGRGRIVCERRKPWRI